MKITQKLIVLSFFLVLIPGFIIGVTSYKILDISVKDGIKSRLMDQSQDWKLVTEAYINNIDEQELLIQQRADPNYKKTTLEDLKNLIAAQVIGKSGYIWVVDDKGTYIVSKQRLRDGEDISQSKDANGALFIQEAIKKAKAAGGNADLIEYPWINEGETRPRIKVAGLTYVKELGWTIGVSAYYDDFDEGKRLVGLTIIILAVILIISLGVAFSLAQKISNPIKELTIAGNKLFDGNLETEIPQIKTNDEIKDLSYTMSILAGAVRFLQKENDKLSKKKKK